MKKLLLNLTVLIAFTPVVWGTQSPDAIEPPRAKIKVETILKDSGLWDRCLEGERPEVIRVAKNYKRESLIEVMAWLKDAGIMEAQKFNYVLEDKVVTKPYTATEICGVLSLLRQSSENERKVILSWVRDNNFISLFDVSAFIDLLNYMRDKNQKDAAYYASVAPSLEWITSLGILKTLNARDVVVDMAALLQFKARTALFVPCETWMRELGMWDKCLEKGTFLEFIKALQNNTHNLKELGEWMRVSGFVNKCDGRTFPEVLSNLRPVCPEVLSKTEGWLKKLGMWDVGSDVFLSEKISKMSKRGDRWLTVMDELMFQYDQWSRTGSAVAIHAFIRQSL
ncbi:MAG: hypothetical protein KBB83_01560 [Alphaproteobacteria bacterium]|nr:hypothetical protein [Alphaproteobacteria bacterium]